MDIEGRKERRTTERRADIEGRKEGWKDEY
jgi:hypothetical protein